jgi:tetratricopeptide (TPR) repeat protein
MSFTNAARIAVLLIAPLATPALPIEDDGVTPPAGTPQTQVVPLSPDEMIRKFPDDPRGYVLSANAAMRKCEMGIAERDIRTALDRAQKHPMFTNNARLRTSMRRMLASVLAMSQQHDKALEEMNVLVKAEPANTEFLFARAQAYVQLNQLEKALDDAGKIIELDNTYFKAWQLRGFTEYRLKRFQAAVTTFTLIAENTEDYPPIVLGMRGQAHAASGKYDMALADYDAAVALAKKQRAEGYSDEIVEREIELKKSNAEGARKAETASPQNAARIRAELFDADQRSLLPTNSLKCQ